MDQTVPNLPPDYYTAPFRLDKVDKFLGADNKQDFFTRSQRSRLVFEILSNTVFGREKKGEVGVDRLVSEGALKAAYPLHDVIFSSEGISFKQKNNSSNFREDLSGRAPTLQVRSSTPDRSCSSSGRGGAGGTSISPSTTSGTTSGRRSPFTSPGSGSTPAGSSPPLWWAWWCSSTASSLSTRTPWPPRCAGPRWESKTVTVKPPCYLLSSA